MHTVELLACALDVAESLGYGIRHEWLAGAMGGYCEIAGRRWLFIDLALSPAEQLDQVAGALQQDARIQTIALPVPLRELLGPRKAA
jgi:hypothetical protein